jgi:3-methyladenine DNA glycosylase/8-oxoguanine DNA glycosylase
MLAPPLDAFGTLVFQVLGQQLSVAATRAILSRLVEKFGGRLPSPAEFLGADAQVLRSSGMSARKVATLRAIAERFADGRLSEEVLAEMNDDEVEAALTEVPGVGPWTAHGFLLIALNRPDVFLPGDVALRRAAQRAYGFDHAPQSWRWTNWRSAGDRIEAWVWPTCSHPNTTSKRNWARHARHQTTRRIPLVHIKSHPMGDQFGESTLRFHLDNGSSRRYQDRPDRA